MSRIIDIPTMPSPIGFGALGSTTGILTAHSLNENYTHYTSGPAYGVRVTVPYLYPITAVYFVIASATTPLSSVTARVSVYGGHPTNDDRPGAADTLIAHSDIVSPDMTTAHAVRFPFSTPITPSIAGQIMWFVIHNTSSSPSSNNFSVTSSITIRLANYAPVLGYTTSNGFSTNGSPHSTQRPSTFVIEFDTPDGPYYWGNMLRTAGDSANNTLRKGMLFIPPLDTIIDHVENFSTSSNRTVMELREFTSTTVTSCPLIADANLGSTLKIHDRTLGTYFFNEPVMVKKNVPYILTVRGSGNFTQALFTQPGAGSSVPSDFWERLFNNVTLCQYVTESSGSWVISTLSMPRMMVLFSGYRLPQLARV